MLLFLISILRGTTNKLKTATQNNHPFPRGERPLRSQTTYHHCEHSIRYLVPSADFQINYARGKPRLAVMWRRSLSSPTHPQHKGRERMRLIAGLVFFRCFHALFVPVSAISERSCIVVSRKIPLSNTRDELAYRALSRSVRLIDRSSKVRR